MIAKRISDLSSNEVIFNDNIDVYRKALEESGFNTEELKYVKPSDNPSTVRQRKRNITWFNPPYSDNVQTNIGRIFFKALKKHFPKEHVLHKVFNKNTVKLSYSCVKNVSAIISSHNKKILKNDKNEEQKCNCRNKNDCPLGNNCLVRNTVYEATVTNDKNDVVKQYIGGAETTFKERFRNHKKDFNNEQYRKSSALSKYVWSLKDDNVTPNITFQT